MITFALPPLDPPQDHPDTPLATSTHDTNPSRKFQHQSSSKDDDDETETESESEPQLSRSPSTVPSTSETPLWTPADDCVFEGRQWVSREEEGKDWKQHLGGAAAADRHLSAPIATSSSAWSSLARSHGEYDL